MSEQKIDKTKWDFGLVVVDVDYEDEHLVLKVMHRGQDGEITLDGKIDLFNALRNFAKERLDGTYENLSLGAINIAEEAVKRFI